MFKSQFESFLRRFEVEWVAERDSEPVSIDTAKYILGDAVESILSFFSENTMEEASELSEIIQSVIKDLKQLGRHEVLLDGGRSYRKFWQKGDKLVIELKKVPQILEKELERVS